MCGDSDTVSVPREALPLKCLLAAPPGAAGWGAGRTSPCVVIPLLSPAAAGPDLVTVQDGSEVLVAGGAQGRSRVCRLLPCCVWVARLRADSPGRHAHVLFSLHVPATGPGFQNLVTGRPPWVEALPPGCPGQARCAGGVD